MRNKSYLIVGMVFIALLLVVSSAVSAQELRPDDRYNGYPKSLIQWTSEPPDLLACQKGEYYEPSDFHLKKHASRVKVAGTRVQEFDECRWMLTRNKWRWVLRPKGTKHLVDALGRDLFDYGSPNSKDDEICYNPSPYGFAIKPKEEPKKPVVSPVHAQPVPPPPVPEVRREIPPPPPTPRRPVIVMPPPTPNLVVVLPPPPPPPVPVIIYDYVYYLPPSPPPEKVETGGSWCGKKCHWSLVALGGAVAAREIWYYWPCPPGTARRR